MLALERGEFVAIDGVLARVIGLCVRGERVYEYVVDLETAEICTFTQWRTPEANRNEREVSVQRLAAATGVAQEILAADCTGFITRRVRGIRGMFTLTAWCRHRGALSSASQAVVFRAFQALDAAGISYGRITNTCVAIGSRDPSSIDITDFSDAVLVEEAGRGTPSSVSSLFTFAASATGRQLLPELLNYLTLYARTETLPGVQAELLAELGPRFPRMPPTADFLAAVGDATATPIHILPSRYLV